MFAATTHNNNILHKTFRINSEKVQEKKGKREQGQKIKNMLPLQNFIKHGQD